MERMQTASQEAKQKSADLSERVEGLQSKLSESQAALSKAEDKVATLQEVAEERKGKIAAMEKTRESLETELRTKVRSMKLTPIHFDRFDHELNCFQSEALIATEAEKNTRLNDLQAQLESARNALAERESEVKGLESKLGDVGGRLEAEKGRVEKLESGLTEKEKELKVTSDKLAASEAEAKEQVRLSKVL